MGVLIFIIKRPVITNADFWWCFISGAGWSLGQLVQFTSFMRLGAATTTPISAGTQLTGVSLIGVLFFASWPGTTAKVIGFTSIVIVIIGIYLTTRTGEKQSSIKPDSQRAKYILELIIGSLIGFGSCTTLPKITNASGWSKFPPQALGMVVAAIIIAKKTTVNCYLTNIP